MKVLIFSFSILAVAVLALSIPPPLPRGAEEPAGSGDGSVEDGPETLVVPMAGAVARVIGDGCSVPMQATPCRHYSCTIICDLLGYNVGDCIAEDTCQCSY